jgi:hypothetical protein
MVLTARQIHIRILYLIESRKLESARLASACVLNLQLKVRRNVCLKHVRPAAGVLKISKQFAGKTVQGNDQGLFNTVRPSGYYMYHQFNIQQFYVLPT